mmetsp:Transcript_31373/g.88003  ORF Transcript_31373/g.88003 Transcript_31373/m.88003 type:complete len:97 (+) Transcript_31373:294-584(+)
MSWKRHLKRPLPPPRHLLLIDTLWIPSPSDPLNIIPTFLLPPSLYQISRLLVYTLPTVFVIAFGCVDLHAAGVRVRVGKKGSFQRVHGRREGGHKK